MRASGLNAALGRQIIADPEFRALAMAGTRFLRTPPHGFSESPLIDDRGSLLAFSATDQGKANDLFVATQQDHLSASVWDAQKLLTQFPFLRGVESALFCPTDGLIDIHALLYGFLHPLRHDNRLVTQARVMKMARRQSRWEITTTAGTWVAEVVVNATGAWAASTAALAESEPISLEVRRRHLFVTTPTSVIDPRAPFLWDVSHGYYFRPESGGIMVSACDESITTPDAAFQNAPDIQTLLLEKLQRYCPRFADLPIARYWAGARTFGPQDKLILRWDRKAPGFFWVAGLGGHGATSAAEIGRRAAEQIYNAI